MLGKGAFAKCYEVKCMETNEIKVIKEVNKSSF